MCLNILLYCLLQRLYADDKTVASNTDMVVVQDIPSTRIFNPRLVQVFLCFLLYSLGGVIGQQLVLPLGFFSFLRVLLSFPHANLLLLRLILRTRLFLVNSAVISAFRRLLVALGDSFFQEEMWVDVYSFHGNVCDLHLICAPCKRVAFSFVLYHLYPSCPLIDLGVIFYVVGHISLLLLLSVCVAYFISVLIFLLRAFRRDSLSLPTFFCFIVDSSNRENIYLNLKKYL